MRMKLIRLGFAIGLLATATLLGFGQSRPDVLIKNATVLTASHGTLENTDILIRNGKIEKIGPGLTAGDGARLDLEPVPQARLLPAQLAAAGDLDALRGPAVGLVLGHGRSVHRWRPGPGRQS